MSAPEIVTFGCRLNIYESEVMRRHALAAGLNDAVIFNTCAVTAEAERQARQSIRKLRRERPSARIIVTGCAAQIDRAKFSAMPEVDRVIGNDEKMRAETFQRLSNEDLSFRGAPLGANPESSLSFQKEETGFRINFLSSALADEEKIFRNDNSGESVPHFDGLQRAFLQVQQGCDHRCTFCIIPFGRGPSRSVPIGVVAEQTRDLVAHGYREIVFTGVDIASYGGDLPGKPGLGQMIRRVLALVPELPRLRLSSLDPAAIDEDMWRLLAEEPRFMPHWHLSLQAGDDMVLKRMKRRHSRTDVIELCERARRLRPDIAFGADIIAGFPTESDAMFENTYNLVEQCGFTWLHVFPYSARKGTPAARMPQVHGSLRKERAERLRALGDRTVASHMNALVGQKFDVLVEQNGFGRTRQFAKIKLSGAAPVGEIVEAEGIADKGEVLAACHPRFSGDSARAIASI
jgi:threonylcarbamoyladenosine tRNA methylthiotransferase MtaB